MGKRMRTRGQSTMEYLLVIIAVLVAVIAAITGVGGAAGSVGGGMKGKLKDSYTKTGGMMDRADAALKSVTKP